MSQVESSLQSSLPIESSSAQEIQSPIGSATSARDMQERKRIMADLQAARQAAARAEKAQRELEKAQREREKAQMEREEMRAELKEMKTSLRRLTRKKKASKAATLRHSDGSTKKLHNVSSVFR